MASSDDESEAVPENVSEYEFVSGEEDPVSFAVLPLEWVEGETRDGKPREIFLSGKTDDGLQKIYKQVIAWKFDLPSKKPEVSVLSAEGYWIKLLKPWRPFHHIIRTILVTLEVLHFAKWNPQRPRKALRGHLKKTFSMFDTVPCEDDLADHLPLVNEAVKRDENLANSKILSALLAEKPWERKTIYESVKPPFIVDDANGKEDQGGFDKTDEIGNDEMDENGDDGSDEDDCYAGICAICDNGGHLYLCDGKCMRSFHATLEDGEDSNCESLGLTDVELRALENADFYCENCKYKMHQCFACGELGSSDESSSPEVFCCVNGACGYFYHPHCVAKLIHPGNSAAADELKERIAAGEKFACPAHRCHVCEEVEVRSIRELQFAVCRRCPRAYHRKCLPREITSADDADEERGIIQRAWEENLIPNRILIYCLDHEIDPDLLTPVRDHIKLPEEKRKNIPLESSKKKNLPRERDFALEDNVGNKISAKPPKGVDKASCSSVRGDLSRKRLEKFPVQGVSKKQKVATNGYSLGKSKQSKTDGGEKSLGDQSVYCTDSERVKCSSGGGVLGKHEKTQKVKPSAKRMDTSLTLDADSTERISALMNDALFSVTLDQVKGRHMLPSTPVQHSKLLSENITMGKVEASVQALRAALKKMDEGGCIQDAKAVCGDALVVQVSRWREKLKVRLAPCLYGERYTSFGRHFTKLDKLKEIVNILHWYVQDGDMLVDFCCGSNDFSCLMKKKVDDMGKSCSFKNYDIHQAKNDFNFERRDWIGVKPNELPDGSQLIMGLNPPFGVKASLANRFIKKALEFKPKLLILIVPRETQRLDAKESPYDLIWEDDQMFVGKSFYLPGSVDVNDKQIEDWNVNPPVLYLWSRSNWTPKHRAIAEQHGHLSGTLKNCRSDESRNEVHVPHPAQECNESDKSLVKKGDDLHVDKPENQEQKKTVTPTANHQGNLPCDVNGSEGAKKSDFVDEGKNNIRSLEDNSGLGGKGKKNVASVGDKSDLGDRGKKNKESLENKSDFGHEEKKNVASVGDKSDIGERGKKNKQSPESRSDFGDKGKKNKQSQEDKSYFGAKGKKNRRSLEDKPTSKPSLPHHLSPNVDKSTRKLSVPRHISPIVDKSTRKFSVPRHLSPNVVDRSETYSPRHADTLVRGHPGRFDHLQFDERNLSRYQPYPEAGYNGDEGMDDLVRRYTLNGEESHHGMTSSQAHPSIPPPGYGFRAPTNRFVGAVEGRANNFDDPNLSYPRTGYPAYPRPGVPSIPYGEMGMSATQLYAPRLDEMNHARMSNMVPGPIYHPHGPRPPFHGSLSFAPGPCPSYPQHSSSGWLDE